MIKKLTIKNFRSLKDTSIDLQSVNLFIGPNNSGKSNVFKAIEFLAQLVENENAHNKNINDYSFQHRGFREFQGNRIQKMPMIFRIDWMGSHIPSNSPVNCVFQLEIYGNDHKNAIQYSVIKGFSRNQIPQLNLLDYNNLESGLDEFYLQYNNHIYYAEVRPSSLESILSANGRNSSYNLGITFHQKAEIQDSVYSLKGFLDAGLFFVHGFNLISKILNTTKIYNPIPSTITRPSRLDRSISVLSDGSNIISFLDNLRDEEKESFLQIEKDFNTCLPEFTNISLPKVNFEPDGNFRKVIKLVGQDGISYAGDEVSEGVLYFLALLCIIHQPNPPRLLLLEEPEKGIHPRRIREVIDLIFELAEKNNIQIIFTTHSPLIVDLFSEETKSVFIFEKPENETIIKNLEKDILKPLQRKLKKDITNIKESLGDHWVMGFLGGIP